jgi:hypothetical protein
MRYLNRKRNIVDTEDLDARRNGEGHRRSGCTVSVIWRCRPSHGLEDRTEEAFAARADEDG